MGHSMVGKCRGRSERNKDVGGAVGTLAIDVLSDDVGPMGTVKASSDWCP